MDTQKEKQAGSNRSSEAGQINEKIAEASKTIFSYCMARTPNRTEAEDLCQDILCALVGSSENIRDSRAFYGFMWAVADNVYRQWCRKRAKLQTCELTEDIPSGESVPDIVLGGENSDLYLLRRELSLLSEKYRQAVVLYYIDRKSCSEISQILSINENRVKYLLFKSRKILKEGMNMERKLGTLSYNPGDFEAMYHGGGPNQFWEFMQGKIRQNIVNACYNDALSPEQVSLETGIPLPYLDGEISVLAEKNILIKEGRHYKANVIILTAECADEIVRSAASRHKEAADLLGGFLETSLPAFREIGFSGVDFSENTLRWQMITFLMREIADFDMEEDPGEVPLTGWGERAYLWLAERGGAMSSHLLNFCQMDGRKGDKIRFMDYIPLPKGSHRDFYGNDYLADILCDIAHGNYGNFSEYDLETVAELVRKGYVLREKDGFKVAMPLFTRDQYMPACKLAKDFIAQKLGTMIHEFDRDAARILGDHAPKHLQNQVLGISSRCRIVNAGWIPLKILLDRKVLNTDWNALEMPTIHIELNK